MVFSPRSESESLRKSCTNFGFLRPRHRANLPCPPFVGHSVKPASTAVASPDDPVATVWRSDEKQASIELINAPHPP
jgi:hypothetical protein